MSWLKSKFVSIYITLISVATIHSLIALYSAESFESRMLWLSVLVAVGPKQLFFLSLLLKPVARTSENLYFLLTSATLGSVMAVYFYSVAGGPLIAVAYALGAGFVGSNLYIFWYSKFGNRENNQKLVVGNTLPNFELEDTDGKIIPSSSFVGNPALIIFYRGNWCPLCMAQIKEVAGQYKALSEQGVKVALVSPQSHENSEGLAKKFDVPFMFLVDKDNRAAKALDILSADGTPTGLELLGYDSDTVMPTVLITDASGKIIFADLTDNYRVRPEPETFIEILRQHNALST